MANTNFYKMLYKTFEDTWEREGEEGSSKVKILNFPKGIDVAYDLFFKIELASNDVIAGSANIKWSNGKLNYDIYDVVGKGGSEITIGKVGDAIAFESTVDMKKIVLKYDMFEGYISGDIGPTTETLTGVKIIYHDLTWEGTSNKVKILKFIQGIDAECDLDFNIELSSENNISGNMNIRWVDGKFSYVVNNVVGEGKSEIAVGVLDDNYIALRIFSDVDNVINFSKISLKYDIVNGYISRVGCVPAKTKDILKGMKLIYHSLQNDGDVFVRDGDTFIMKFKQNEKSVE